MVLIYNTGTDAPIQFEIMQGQEIDPQTELMDKLEETAINATRISNS